MLLRDERLGDVSEDVLGYISSREADKRIFQADLMVNRAHLVMLREKGLVSKEDCSSILSALKEIKESDLGESEDVHEALEAQVISRVGSLGGRMHTGRSRNDEVATCIRVALRGEMIDLMEELLSLIETALCLAEGHTETVMPGFTHTQHAQPTTLAHHLLAHADAFSRDLDRLREAYSRVNLSPLGAAAFASTGFDLDRKRTCQLLCFDGLIENSMDAVSARDFALEVLADLAILMVNLSRVAEELVLWSSLEFYYLELDNRYASTSSIMPQKKNPDTAELARAKSGSVLGSLISALAICKALPMSYNRDLQELTPHLWRGMDWARSTVRILNGCLSTARFNTLRLYERSGAGFSTATELADSMVRSTGMPFRTAHQIVGRLASQKSSPSQEDLDAVALELSGAKPSCQGFTEEMFKRALDPKFNLALRAGIGGPAPEETRRMISARTSLVRAKVDMIKKMREKVEKALEDLTKME